MKQASMQSMKYLALAAILSAAGCGLSALPPVSVVMKSAEEQAEATNTTSEGSETKTGTETENPAAPATEGGIGDFVGTVKLNGEPPALAPLVAQGQAVQNKEVCSVMAVPNESIVVDPATKGIQNVFIYIEKAPPGAKAPAQTDPIIFDQKGCRFLPHAMVVRAKLPVLIMSSDNAPHNTHTFPKKNGEFNSVISPLERKGVKLVYDLAEKQPVEVKCDYHAWMKAYHLPLDHGFASVTNEKGEFSIKGLPAGNYSFKVWHEAGQMLERDFKIAIKAGENKKDFSYEPSQFSK